MTVSKDVAVDGNGDVVDGSHFDGGQRPLRPIAVAAVTAGNGSCGNRQRQAKAAAAMGTATAGNSSKGSCEDGQQPLL